MIPFSHSSSDNLWQHFNLPSVVVQSPAPANSSPRSESTQQRYERAPSVENQKYMSLQHATCLIEGAQFTSWINHPQHRRKLLSVFFVPSELRTTIQTFCTLFLPSHTTYPEPPVQVHRTHHPCHQQAPCHVLVLQELFPPPPRHATLRYDHESLRYQIEIKDGATPSRDKSYVRIAWRQLRGI